MNLLHVSAAFIGSCRDFSLVFSSRCFSLAPAVVGGKLFHRSDEVVTASGLRYTDLKVGDGPRPRIGQTIRVNYVGWLEDGREIDNSSKRAGPAQFVLGPALIAGWNEALQTMRVGGKRRLIIPPNLAYGASGVPPNIPPNATLTFEVELLDVR